MLKMFMLRFYFLPNNPPPHSHAILRTVASWCAKHLAIQPNRIPRATIGRGRTWGEYRSQISFHIRKSNRLVLSDIDGRDALLVFAFVFTRPLESA